MCTASILHLVVISLDRYIAVTHPITYPNLMTSKKAKLLITGAWILSFVICFPPLVGWNDKDELEEGAESDLNNTSSKLVLKIRGGGRDKIMVGTSFNLATKSGMGSMVIKPPKSGDARVPRSHLFKHP